MDLKGDILNMQILLEKASRARLEVWSKIEGLFQGEIEGRFGFAIEPIGILQEQLDHARQDNTPQAQGLISELERLLDIGE